MLTKLALVAQLLPLVFLAPRYSPSGPPPILQPAVYTSASGEFSLLVDPSDRHGDGGSFAELRKGDEVAWAKQLDNTFWQAAVSDTGVAMGFGFTKGSLSSLGEFFVQSFSPTGEVLASRAEARYNSNEMHSPPYPWGAPPILNEVGDYFLAPVISYKGGRSVRTSWVFRMADGEFIGDFDPRKGLTDWTVTGALSTAPIPGTPLLLTHWGTTQKGLQNLGAYFQVSDHTGREIWSTSFPADYEDPANEKDYFKALAIRNSRSYSRVLPGASFQVDERLTSTRRTFAVTQDASGAWKVAEANSEVFTVQNPIEEGAIGKSQAGMPNVPLVQLEVAGTTNFRTEDLEQPPAKDVYNFAVNDKGQIGVLRKQEGDSRTFELLDAAGKAEVIIDLGGIKPDAWARYKLCWLQDDRWLVVAHWDEDDVPTASAHWVNSKTGAVTKIDGWEGLGADVLRRMSDGGFVILGSEKYGRELDRGLVRFGKQGRRLWHITEHSEYPIDVFDAEDVCVTPAGQVVVLENGADRLVVFQADGTHEKTIDLTESLGFEPSYPTQILALPEGGYILQDSDLPRFLMLDENFKLLDRKEPYFLDRAAKNIRDLVLGADGTLWAADESAFLQLDRKLFVERTLGAAPNDEALDEHDRTYVSPSGGVYLTDTRNGNIHVFDRGGTRRFTCHPDDADLGDSIDIQDLRVTSGGDIILTTSLDIFEGRDVRFNNKGERLGHVHNPDTWSARTIDLPGSTNTWQLHNYTLKLQDEDGKTLEEITRTPIGTFFIRPRLMALAPDGSVAIYDAAPKTMGRPTPGDLPFTSPEAGANVHIFRPDGTPLTTLQVPAGTSSSDIAFQGEYVAVSQGSDAGILIIHVPTNATQLTQPTDSETIFFSPDGKELWTFPYRMPTMTRYALP